MTAAYLDLCVTDIHWVETDASGTIEDLIVGGHVIQSSGNHAGELRGRVTLDLAERSTFPAAQLCEILHVVEWMQPLRRIEALLPRATRAEIPPTVLYRFGAPFVEATEVAWDTRSSTRTFHGLRLRCTGNRTRSFRLADRFTFDTWALTAIADALDVARS